MKITFVGHAGLFIETAHGSILTDPWFNPAYFASWFPFPSNEDVDLRKIGSPDYLFISHIHHDHFDPAFLREHVSKDATVLLPDFPLDHLERALRDLGFTTFLYTKHGQTVEHNGLKLTILASVAPTDGPLGDSGLIVDDGEVRIYDQNDSRPVDIDLLQRLGPYDAHFVQFSGAIWYPMVYTYPPRLMEAYGRKKRENEMARALRYIQEVGARHVVPHAGPPCFLDDALWSFNDFDRNPTNTFPDQTVFLEYLAEHGYDRAHLLIPGSEMALTRQGCTVRHAQPEAEVRAIFTDKRGYLEAYKARKQHVIDAEKANWPRDQVEILPALKEWFEPLLAIGDVTCVGINGRVLLEWAKPAGEGEADRATPVDGSGRPVDAPTRGEDEREAGLAATVEETERAAPAGEGVVIDYQNRSVYAWEGQECEYRFKLDPALVEWCIVNHAEDWINTLFLSCRFEATRNGPFNEYVYNFFKCLTPERLEYAEGYYAERSADQQLMELEGYRIQRRCPHLKADLARFGRVEDGVLTCMMHGWRFELATGKCLTSDDRKLYSVPISAEQDAANGGEATAPAPYVPPPSVRCKHCWFLPEGSRRTSPPPRSSQARPREQPDT